MKIPKSKIVRKFAPMAAPAGTRAKGCHGHTRGEMNSLEAAYAEFLEEERREGRVSWFAFEALKLKIGPGAYYTPDFLVMGADGALEVHEVKGGLWLAAARVRIKVAAGLYPFRFLGVQKIPKRDGGGWKREEF